MQRYAITDRRLFAGSEADRRNSLIAQAERLARAGVDYLQVREKDLTQPQLRTLIVRICEAVANTGGSMRVLVNGNTTVAQEAGSGLHLPVSALLAPALPSTGTAQVVSVSCHTLTEVEMARDHAEVLLFSPVFEKRVEGERVRQGVGLPALSAACLAARGTPVFALGGVTPQNAMACVSAGAAGVAGIRLFF